MLIPLRRSAGRGRKPVLVGAARDGDVARLREFTQFFEQRPVELGALVKEQDTMTGETDFARARN